MVLFEKRKSDVLAKLDKSKKGDVDQDVKKLVDKINSLSDYYTTSSCSGRILLLTIPKDYRKDKVEWLFVSHDKVSFGQIKKALESAVRTNKNDIWLRQESMIMHICCKTIADAQKLRDIASNLGFKRSGIIASRKNIVMELIATENMDTIVARKGKILVSEKYMQVLAEELNKKMARTKAKIVQLFQKLKNL